ncbi:MAG: transposase [Actinobacteria bacterium]|nr:transposase [Actinomycetota bacterium]
MQVVNGGLYLRGLLEQGPCKSLEPMCERLGRGDEYQSLQQFIAVSPCDPAVVMRNVAGCVLPAIDGAGVGAR